MKGSDLVLINTVSETINKVEKAKHQDLPIEVGQIVEHSLKFPVFKDALYMKLKERSKSNSSLPSKIRIWKLWLALAAAAPPSKVRILNKDSFCMQLTLRRINH